MKSYQKTKNVILPKATFQRMTGAMTAVEEAKKHLEDFLLLSNKKVITELHRAKLDYIKGRVGNWQSLKARYGVSPHSHSNI